MLQLKPLSLTLLLASALATTTEEGSPSPTTDLPPSPTWTPLDMPLPWPYQAPSLNIPLDNPQTATLGLLYSNPCGGHTDFASTTIANLPVPCHGATALSVSLRIGRCPLGRAGPPGTVDTVTATPRTSFGYICAPTPAPSVTINVADVTRTMGLPTLRPEQTPPMTATKLEVVHHPGGECRVDLGLEGIGVLERGEWTSRECVSERVYPREWERTVTRVVEVGCDGCEYIRGGVVTASCARGVYGSLVQSWGGRTRTEGVRTVWAYECFGRG